MQQLCHENLWEGIRVRPSYTRRWRKVIPPAAAPVMAAAKIVIYCRGVNKTAPSLVLFSLPSNPCVHNSSEKDKHRSELQPQTTESLWSAHPHKHAHIEALFLSLQLQVSELCPDRSLAKFYVYILKTILQIFITAAVVNHLSDLS